MYSLCLIGDFNSRVACEKDYFDLVDFENPVLDDNILRNACSSNDFMELQKYGFFVDRESNDKTINQYGKKLINICKNCNIFILNGRSKHDKNGAYTCKSSSVVDYCIASVSFIKHVSEMRVLPFSQLLSDVHNPIQVILSSIKSINTGLCTSTNDYELSNKCMNIDVAKRWVIDDKVTYHNVVDSKISLINSLEDSLICCTTEHVSLDYINSIVEETGNILVQSAKEVFGTQKPYSCVKKPKAFKKPWFTRECKSARQNFRKAKRLYKKYGGEIFRNNLYEKERLYKKKLKHAVGHHRAIMKDRLKYLRTTDPKEYWKILNTNCGNKSTCNADLKDLFDFYNKCCNTENDGPCEHILSEDELKIVI